jgi:hypothetical protein
VAESKTSIAPKGAELTESNKSIKDPGTLPKFANGAALTFDAKLNSKVDAVAVKHPDTADKH